MPNLSLKRFCAAVIAFSLVLTAGSAVFTARQLDVGANASLSAGSASDPLISRAYLENITKPYLLTYINQKFGTSHDGGPYGQVIREKGDSALADISKERLADLTVDDLMQPYQNGIMAPGGGNYQLVRLTDTDSLIVPSGATVYVLSGNAMGLTAGTATAIDVFQGKELSGDWLYVTGRQLVVTERGGMRFETLDEEATLLVSGGQMTARQKPSSQYTDLADALKTMGLFVGTDKGYKLERPALRGEALALVIRLLGKESAALSAKNPATDFSDVLPWLVPYASYAVKNGITIGVGNGMFGYYLAINANEYMTFLLRALGYKDTGANPDFHYKSAIEFAVSKKILTANEGAMLLSGQFTRDKLVYISYYTLFAYTKDGNKTLLQTLIDGGAVSLANAEKAIASVTRVRK